MEQLSYWQITHKTRSYPQLQKDLETDVLIVGGGISGITAAYCLSVRGIKPILIEADEIASGTTGKTTGKMTAQHGVIYQNLIEKYGIDIAREFAASQLDALNFAAQTVAKLSINCQMTESTSFLYAMTTEEKDILLAEYEAAKRMDLQAEWVLKPDFPPKCKAMTGLSGQAVIHPVRYVQGLLDAALANGAKIYTHTKAVSVDIGDIKTVVLQNGAVIRCRHLIQATQYPIYDGLNAFYARLYAKRDHAVAIDPKGRIPDGNFINIGEPVHSIRSHMENGKQILILVGEAHAPGREEDREGMPYDRLIEFGKSLTGVNEVLATWSAQDYQTPDQIAYIGRLQAGSDIYVAAGFNKWGLLSGTLAGMMLSEMVATGHCKYEELYSRKRPDIISSLGKAANEVFTAAGELIKSKFEKTGDARGLQKGEGRMIRFQGQKAGIYRDENDHITVLDITCTHMGTELNFNAEEKTWDCPAHGGRFQTNGNLIEGPPKDSLKVLFEGSLDEFMHATGHGGTDSDDSFWTDETIWNDNGDVPPAPGMYQYPIPPGLGFFPYPMPPIPGFNRQPGPPAEDTEDHRPPARPD